MSQFPIGYDVKGVQDITGMMCWNPVEERWERVSCASGNSGAINVTQGISASIFEYDDAINVPDNTLTTVLSHTNGAAIEERINFIQATGTADAEFHIVIDTVTKMKFRTSEQVRTMKIEFPPHILAVGSIIDVKVVHFDIGLLCDFNASLIGHRA